MRSSGSTPACWSTSAIRTTHGNAPPTRTPTGCCASTSRNVPTSPLTKTRISLPWRPPSMHDPAKPSIGKLRPRRLTYCSRSTTNNQLRRPLESAQYAAHDYRRLLDEHGMICSMSRKGDCWDNAPMESFFGSLKTELEEDGPFPTRQAARTALFGFIEGFYNRQRLHSEIGYVAPNRKEQLAAAA